jgi:hypothetical protein
MVYARVHDKTAAEDYFKAMQQVEEQLALPMNPLKSPSTINELLVLVDSLNKTVLNPAQREIVSALRYGLVWLTMDPIRKANVNVLVVT